MKILLNILKYIFIILLTVCTITLGLVYIGSSKILSKDYVLSKLESTNYYEELNQIVQEAFENYIGPSGFDEDVMEGVANIEQIKQDTNTILNNIYNGTNVEVSTESVETNLRNNISKSLDGRELTATEQKAIDQYVKKITSLYTSTICHTSLENDIYNVISKINGLVGTAKIALAVAIVVLIVVIVLFNRKNRFEVLSNIGIVLTSSGLLYIILNLYINSEIPVSNITTLNSAFSNTLRNIINDMLGNILVFGIVFSVLGIIVIVVGQIKGSKNKKENNNKHENKSGKRSK